MAGKTVLPEEDEFLALVKEYVLDMKQQAPRIRQWLDSGAFDSIERAGHNLKGTGGLYGFDVLTQIGTSLEKAAVKRDVEVIERLCEELAVYISEIGIE